MNRWLATLFLCASLALATGCTPTATNPVTLAPGYNNIPDQDMGKILSGANAFYHSIQCQTYGLNWSLLLKQCVSDPAVTTPLLLTASVKQGFNEYGIILDSANSVYLAYHAGTATEAQAQAAVSTAQSMQPALPATALPVVTP